MDEYTQIRRIAGVNAPKMWEKEPEPVRRMDAPIDATAPFKRGPGVETSRLQPYRVLSPKQMPPAPPQAWQDYKSQTLQEQWARAQGMAVPMVGTTPTLSSRQDPSGWSEQSERPSPGRRLDFNDTTVQESYTEKDSRVQPTPSSTIGAYFQAESPIPPQTGESKGSTTARDQDSQLPEYKELLSQVAQLKELMESSLRSNSREQRNMKPLNPYLEEPLGGSRGPLVGSDEPSEYEAEEASVTDEALSLEDVMRLFDEVRSCSMRL